MLSYCANELHAAVRERVLLRSRTQGFAVYNH